MTYKNIKLKEEDNFYWLLLILLTAAWIYIFTYVFDYWHADNKAILAFIHISIHLWIIMMTL